MTFEVIKIERKETFQVYNDLGYLQYLKLFKIQKFIHYEKLL